MSHKYLNIILFLVWASTFINIVGSFEIENVVGGQKAQSEDILYQSSLIVKGSPSDKPNAPCAAASVDNDHLISVASCFTDHMGNRYKRWYEVMVGAKNLLDTFRNKIVGVDKIFIPASFDWRHLKNDIAVIKLNESLDFAIHTRLSKVNLPKGRASYNNVVAKLSGYGHIMPTVAGHLNGQMTYSGFRDWDLRNLYVKIISNRKCKKTHHSVHYSQICGLGVPEQKYAIAGACALVIFLRNLMQLLFYVHGDFLLGVICTEAQGDLGGPLVFQNELIGVLSIFDTFCDDTQEAARYTRVSSFRSFIKSVLDGKPPKDTRIDTEP